MPQSSGAPASPLSKWSAPGLVCMSCSKARSLPEVKYIGGCLLSGFGCKKRRPDLPKGKRERRLRCRIRFSMCHICVGGLHGKEQRVKALSECSKSVVNSVSLSRNLPVFLGFFEIIRVVILNIRMLKIIKILLIYTYIVNMDLEK